MHVACVRERRGATEFWWGNLKIDDHLEKRGVDGRILLRCFLNKPVGRT